MTDWTIGTGGTMRITDTGTYVEFWLNSNNSTTYAYQLPWGYTVNGVTDNSNQFSYSQGAGWERLGRWLVTTDQTVTFRLFDTGTGRFGSGESHSQFINRTSAPPTPGAWTIEQIADTWVQGDTDNLPNGGIALDQIQVRYSRSSAATSPLYINPGLDAYATISGLAKGSRYYFWIRTHNSKGWSPWSASTTAVTHNIPSPPSSVTVTNVRQTTASTKFVSDPADSGGTPFTSHELGYGTSGAAPTKIITDSDGVSNLTGLTPGVTYYFWARSKNKYGASSWSPRTSAKTLAAMRYFINGSWKTAVPYVRVGGVWKPAKPYVKIGGLWKETG